MIFTLYDMYGLYDIIWLARSKDPWKIRLLVGGGRGRSLAEVQKMERLRRHKEDDVKMLASGLKIHGKPSVFGVFEGICHPKGQRFEVFS